MSSLKICTEVAGTVWKVVAATGAARAAGQEILIMESMKMEIPVEAPRAGRLLELRVAEGDVLKEGDV
ncbi:MAG: biotin/lipoyl-containing protein, partial [Burkholderiales bacterium]